MANLTSLLILLLFLWGRSLRFRNLRLHITAMLCALVLDLGVVLALVFGRHALSSVNSSMPWPLMIHVPIAVTTLLLYFPTAIAGYLLWQGNERARPWLRVFDKFLVPLRVLTLVTSVMVQVFKG